MRLFQPTAIAPLVQIRAALGLILFWEAYRYIIHEWPRRLFLDPRFLFKYDGFAWIHPLPDTFHLAVFPVLAALAVALTIGFFYRAAACLLFLGWSYVFLLDQALYLNHFYLVIVVLGLMIFLPAHRAFSLDVLWRPRLYSATVPSWTIDILRFQIAVVYIFGGIAKLNADWISGVPMQIMLLGSADLFGQFTGEPWAALLFAYAGLLLDLTVVPLLCWKRTRLFALVMVAAFHITNHLIFQIGIFPWIMLAATIILWPPRRLTMLGLARLYGGLVLIGMFITVWAYRAAPPERIDPREIPEHAVPAWVWALALIIAAILIFPPDSWKQFPFERQTPIHASPGRTRPLVLAVLLLFASWQILIPLRHFLYPGNVSWTEQGHRWAWHMKLRMKIADEAVFYIRDENGRVLEIVDVFARSSPLSLDQAEVMSTRPDMALEFAHHLRDRAEDEYDQPVRVTVLNTVSLNGRPFQTIIDPKADLANIENRLWSRADWIEPLTTPRRPLTRIDVDRIDGPFEYIEAGEQSINSPLP